MRDGPTSLLRSFRFPGVWLAVWALMILLLIVSSLMRGPPIPELLTIYKVDHFVAYLMLEAFAVQLFWPRYAQFNAALAMVALGAVMELAQGYQTTYRDMSLYDADVDAVGVAVGLASAWTPLADLLWRFEARYAHQ